MNIIGKRFYNNINLAICIFPADTLRHDALKEKMIDYTMFYALRLQQLGEQIDPPVKIHIVESIDAGLEDLSNKYNHILFMAAGVRVYDLTILFDIQDEIMRNPNYFCAAHILDWQDKWYELHHQFVLVNTEKWRLAKFPKFGGWEVDEAELPIIERSKENFHDNYTPLWIRFTGEFKKQLHSKQGWSFINAAALNNFDIINWSKDIRNKRTYYYPESDSDQFYTALQTLEIDSKANVNQRTLIDMCNTMKGQIWILNSEAMDLKLQGETFDTIALPAAGFKFLDVFYKNSLNEHGKLIIYDFNPKSIEWIKTVHKGYVDFEIQAKFFKYKHDFKIYRHKVIGHDGEFLQPFRESLQKTYEYFSGKENFRRLIKLFREFDVDFVQVDIIKDPSVLVEKFRGKTAINISNIFCTDFGNAIFGLKKCTELYEDFLLKLPNQTLVLGHDSYCRAIKKKIINETRVEV